MQYIQPDTRANVGLYHNHCIQRVRPVTGDDLDAQNRILERVLTAQRINKCGIRECVTLCANSSSSSHEGGKQLPSNCTVITRICTKYNGDTSNFPTYSDAFKHPRRARAYPQFCYRIREFFDFTAIICDFALLYVNLSVIVPIPFGSWTRSYDRIHESNGDDNFKITDKLT